MNNENYTKLSKGEKFIADWQMCIQGGFKSSLLNSISKADENNRASLRLAFPEEVDAFMKFRTESGWWTALAKKLEIPE